MVSTRRASSVADELVVALPSEQDHLVTHLDVAVGTHVDHQLVHGHDADDGAAPTTDQHGTSHQAETSAVAVGVAHGHGGDDGRRVEDVAVPVGDALPLRHGLHEADGRRPAHRRTQRRDPGQHGRGRDAVDGDARPDEVEVGARVQQRGRGVGGVAEAGVDAGRGEVVEDLLEAVELAWRCRGCRVRRRRPGGSWCRPGAGAGRRRCAGPGRAPRAARSRPAACRCRP